jgi:hypothetical protein
MEQLLLIHQMVLLLKLAIIQLQTENPFFFMAITQAVQEHQILVGHVFMDLQLLHCNIQQLLELQHLAEQSTYTELNND